MDLIPYFWIIFGLMLILIEFFTTSFFILWFGISALIVGITVLVYPHAMDSFVIQLTYWIIASVITIVLWFKAFKPASKLRQINAGLNSGEIIGETGVLVKVPTAHRPGSIRFTVAMFGKTEWQCTAKNNHELRMGDSVVVKGVENNLLLVDAVE